MLLDDGFFLKKKRISISVGCIIILYHSSL